MGLNKKETVEFISDDTPDLPLQELLREFRSECDQIELLQKKQRRDDRLWSAVMCVVCIITIFILILSEFK